MSETLTFLTQFQEQLQLLNRDGLSSFREKHWKQLVDLGLPLKSHEAYRYVSLRELYQTSFAMSQEEKVDKSWLSEAILPECVHSYLVFINGCFSTALSDFSALPSQVLILPLDEAIRSHASFLQSQFNRMLKEEKDPFAFLNFALHPKGAFFYVPPKVEVSVPVQCIHIITGQASQASIPRLYLAVGAHSKLECVVSYHVLNSAAHLSLPSMEIALEENAHFNLLNLIDEIPTCWHFESIRAVLKKRARLSSLTVTTGAKAVRQSYRVQLKGQDSEAHLNGLWMLSKNRTAHIHATIEHEAPHTHSMQLFKGVLNDVSQSSFEGKILVHAEAQKTEAYQLNNNLILSQGAIANSKPNLEVFADDVKASHGATVTQLDEDQLFYLSTRGIGKEDARRLLLSGFCGEMIEKIPYPSVLKKMQKHIENFVNRDN